jgi:diaminohydroxyphosphoribosylaminopyrimidine deaminase/5-amino-6-(5-phosphoribosylamino)uracil reductase
VRELAARGAEVVPLAEPTAAAVVADLAARGVRSLLVEGGAGASGAFLDAGIWDRVVVFAAPILVGGERAVPPVAGAGIGRLQEAARLGPLRIARRGADLEISGENVECSRVLSSSVGV